MPPMGGCFDLSFFLAFEPRHIYNELVVHPRSRHPLGAAPNVAFAILRPGYDPKNEVSPGCVRKVSFASPFFGETVSELTVSNPGSASKEGDVCEVVWRQLSSSTRLNLLGDGVNLPEFGVRLEGGASGTLVTMTYNFARAELSGPLCCIASCMSSVLKWHMNGSIAGVWHIEMVRRGYVPLRRFRMLKSDVSEEEQIRERARTPRE